ncbi:MAG: UDP-3-O-[3-hydroxymyristoyl] N-acetylglucosamine deacetylase [Candidatus Omnitrophica bacterium]|nr:UDP-3-O-[3-hydroxymyristoyl] N-acetylglucosamine deacetylase [Candidatus Omnitrophota bacterium]
MSQQKTIERETSIEGIGLHSGQKVKLRFKPAPQNSGISFTRVDAPNRPSIQAHASRVIDPTRRLRRTSIGNGEVEIHTIEHLMSALAGLQIDNLNIEINGEEIPGLDGSALPFAEVLLNAGIVEQPDTSKRVFQAREPVWAEEKSSSIIVLPCDNFKVSYVLSYDHHLLKAQYVEFEMDVNSYLKEIAPARTFCLQQEAEDLRRQGLGKGADYENTVVVGEKGVIDNKLRFEDEFARHKISDLIGDLYLLGASLKGHVLALKSGHSLNIKLLQKLSQQEEKLKEAGLRATYVGTAGPLLDINDIQKILPHRYPFLLIDRILELEEDKRAVGIKNVTINDNFFPGHFPGRPVMPGVLIVEAMAQVAGVLMLHKQENLGKLAFFMSMDKVKFRRPVIPGDQLRLEVEVVKLRSKTGQVATRAIVDSKVVAESELMFSLVEA